MSYGANERKPLLNFSETQERASLINTDIEEDSMARKRKGRKGRKGKRSLKGIKRKGVRLNKGRIALRVRRISRTSIFDCFRAGSIYSSLKAKGRSKKGSHKDGRKEEKSKEGKEAKVKEEVI